MRSNHISQQFRQLPMFMTAREIMNDYQGLDADREEIMGEHHEWTESDTEMFDRKYSEADDAGLVDDLLQHGVKNPVSLQANPQKTGYRNMPEILGGHHRIAVMNQHRPNNLMPVEHFESYVEAQRSLGDRY